jgi:hypothetical protein
MRIETFTRLFRPKPENMRLTPQESSERIQMTTEVISLVQKQSDWEGFILEAYAFGSTVDGTAKKKSDFDLAVLTPGAGPADPYSWGPLYTALQNAQQQLGYTGFEIRPTLIPKKWLDDPSTIPDNYIPDDIDVLDDVINDGIKIL